MGRQLAFAFVAVLTACSSDKGSAPPVRPDDAAAVRAHDAAPVRGHDAAPVPSDASTAVIPAASTQLVVVATPSWSAERGVLYRFDRQGTSWSPVGSKTRVTIGHAGLGWGRGLKADAQSGEPVKREGDGRSPAGLFSIGAAYGYGPSAPAGSALRYEQLGNGHRCVDDPASKHYNRILIADDVEADWKSAEEMRRSDELYRWVVLIDHNSISGNAEPTPRAGSCIFFHVWGSTKGPTVGCAAMDQGQIEKLMTWLVPTKNPVVVMVPQPIYDRLRGPWQLPALPK